MTLIRPCLDNLSSSFIRKISLISCKDNLTNWIPFLITEFCLEQFKLSIFLKNIILRKMFIGQCALCYFYTQYFEPFKYPSRPKEPNSKCINITFDPQDRLSAILSEAPAIIFYLKICKDGCWDASAKSLIICCW